MALLLRDVVGLSYTEIADSLEITLATVKWRIYKAREEVQLALAREGITFGVEAEGAGSAGLAAEPRPAPYADISSASAFGSSCAASFRLPAIALASGAASGSGAAPLTSSPHARGACACLFSSFEHLPVADLARLGHRQELEAVEAVRAAVEVRRTSSSLAFCFTVARLLEDRALLARRRCRRARCRASRPSPPPASSS